MQYIIMLLCFFVIDNAFPQNSEDDVIVVVVNRENQISSLTKAQLKSIYLAKTQKWETGASIIPLHLKAKSAERETLSRYLFRKSSFTMKGYWLNAKEQGKPIRKPREMRSARRLLYYISRRKNAIGYVRMSDYSNLKKKKKDKVKWIALENIEPSVSNAQSKKYLLFVSQ